MSNTMRRFKNAAYALPLVALCVVVIPLAVLALATSGFAVSIYFFGRYLLTGKAGKTKLPDVVRQPVRHPVATTGTGTPDTVRCLIYTGRGGVQVPAIVTGADKGPI
jgi:hypothetical protein